MSRCILLVLGAVISLVSAGCCGISQCSDCDGIGYGETVIPQRPLDRVRSLRKNLVCGSGCGGVYVDEWISSPPDCADPCHGTDFVGGATPCQLPCWQPVVALRRLLRGLLLGGRYCATGACGGGGCSSGGCDSCSSGDGHIIESHNHGSSCGCGSHTAAIPSAANHTASRIVPERDSVTYQRFRR